MRWPELVYAPAASDIRKSIVLPRRVLQQIQTTQAVGSLIHRFGPVPKDSIFVLHNAVSEDSAGGAQVVTEQIMFVAPSAGPIILAHIAHAYPAGGGLANVSLNFSGEVLIMPEEFFQMEARFNAGVAVNAHRSSIVGVLVPRANVQFATLEVA